MLSESTVSATRGLAATLTNTGLRLGVKTGTPLQVIMSEQAPMFVGRNVLEVTQEDIDKELTATAHTQMFGAAQHTAAQKGFAERIRKQVEQSVRFARSEVNPLVNDIIDSVTGVIRDMRNQNALERPVVLCKLSTAYRNDFLLEQIKPHAGRRVEPSVIEGTFARRLLSLSTSERLDAMKTTSASLNAAIEKLQKEEDIVGMLDTGFRDASVADPYNATHLLAKFLFFRGIHLGRVETLNKDTMSTGERVAIANMVVYFASAVNKVISVADSHTSAKRIVLDANSGSIKVHEGNYLAWLKKNGSIEALLGFVATNSSDVSGLLDNPEKFEMRYKTAKASADSTTSVECNAEVESYTSSMLTRYINDEMEAEERPAAHARLRAIRKEFQYAGNRTIDEYVRMVVCKTIAHDTDALEFLNAMDQCFKDDPDMKPQEAAVMASATMVVRYVVRQLDIEQTAD